MRGNIVYKSDVGRYWYDSQRPNRLANITLEGYAGAQPLAGSRALSYVFDDYSAGAQTNANGLPVGNGNLLYTVSHDAQSGKHTVRWETYTSFNMPAEIKYGSISVTARTPDGTTSDRTLGFTYGPEHQRVKQVVTLTNNAPTSLMGGTTWYLHGGDNNLLFEKELKANGITEQRHYLQAAGMTFALAVVRTGAGVSAAAADRQKRPTQLSYYQQDHLGSIAVITDELGAVMERMAYDPWGKRRYPNGLSDNADTLVGVNTDRGYTLHEHLDEVGVIHMNGRVYDPLIGRFMSADPFIQAPGNLQSYNRYAYVTNNPLVFTDPSGYRFGLSSITGSLYDVVDSAVRGSVNHTGTVINAALKPLPEWSRGVVIAAVSVYACGPNAPGCAAMLTAYAAGSSAYASGASGTEAARAGGRAGATAYAFSWAGDVYDGNATAGYAAHAGVGCASSVASGVSCGQGAASAVFGKYVTVTSAGYFNVRPGEFNGYHMSVTMIAGGVGSVIAGGKFENGAKTAAFGYLFNHLGEHDWGRSETLQDHFDRHGGDFDARNPADYAKQAQDFRTSALNTQGTEFRIDADGTLRIYDRVSNTFGAYNADGTTKTFYKPGAGERYWDSPKRGADWGPKIDSSKPENLNQVGKALRVMRIIGRNLE